MSDSPIDFMNSLTLEELEIKPDQFSHKDRQHCKEWCKRHKPYWCPYCHSMTMLDRGKKFQCQLCSTEYECVDRNEIDEWRKKVKKRLMGSI